MILISETEFRRASGVGLKKPQTKILGEIALKGSVSGKETLELARDPRLVEDLLERKIIKRNPSGTYGLGEFGPGHCQWIWGKRGKPAIRKKQATKRKNIKPKKRPPEPSAPRHLRDAEHEARKRRAIERYRRRFRP